MLDYTKNQSLLLEIFFENPEKKFYLRQLARLLKKEPGNFQRDINKLVKNSILLSEYEANNRFFRINKEYSLYNELRDIFFKTFGVGKRIQKILNTVDGIEIAFIFGSFAKRKEDTLSDVDLMLIGKFSEDKLFPLISRLESKLSREINYHIFSISDWKEKIKNKDSFIQSIQSNPKIFLKGNEEKLSKIS